MADRPTFTGRSRQRRTRRSVRFVDRFATGLITVGGIGTIGAVSGVCVYLACMVVPLFRPASLADPQALARSNGEGPPAVLRVSESDEIGWSLDGRGAFAIFRPRTGERLGDTRVPSSGPEPTVVVAPIGEDAVTIGDGTGAVRLGSVKFEAEFLDPSVVESAPLADLEPGELKASDGAVISLTPQGQPQRESVVADFDGEPMKVSTGSAVLRVDRVDTDSGPVLLAWSADGRARLVSVDKTEDLFTGGVKLAAGSNTLLPVEGVPAGPPVFVGLIPRAAEAWLTWADGTTLRYDTRERTSPKLIDRTDLLPDGRKITSAAWMVGRLTLLVGDDQGDLAAWFPARSDAFGDDRERLIKGHEFAGGPAPVVAITPSSRSRLAAVGHADGTIRLVQVTTDDVLAESSLANDAEAGGDPKGGAAFAPMALFLPPSEGESALYAAAGSRLFRAPFDAASPEAGFTAFFRPVWYESYPEPRQVWQTSSGTNAAEPKLGLVPLIFGTLKATCYSMLFGVPLAMLAALYTSEFLSRSARARVKPVIEVMASLPSVVLGFLAAVVFAPVVEDWLPAVIASAFTVPLTLLTAARLWQLSKISGTSRGERLRLPLAACAILVGLALAAATGPLIERWLFAGDVKRWLSGRVGSGAGAWLLLLLPISGTAVAFLVNRRFSPILEKASASWTRRRFVAFDFARFAAAAVATLAIAAALSYLLAGLDALLPIDLDPRGSYVGTYVQRNALVVGFVMGFAIIPIIYTLADDALHAVPESLRSASLGAGATPWQTALRVVIPTAMSGLFSAVMVGLGRAVGETMIVLMAAGNTPIMELNLFNGFQTLSAAIATEMPEAVRGSTHFRTLFLAALVLFALTFVVNTVAELVRLRFRRRVVQL